MRKVLNRWIAGGILALLIAVPAARADPAGTRALIAELRASTEISVEVARLSWQLDRANAWFDDLGGELATADEIAGNARAVRAHLQPRLEALRELVRSHRPQAASQPPLYADPPRWTGYLRGGLADVERQVADLDALILAVGRMDIEEVFVIRLQSREALLAQFERGLRAMQALQNAFPADHPDHLLIQSELELWGATRAAYEMQVGESGNYEDLLRDYPGDLRRGVLRSEAALAAAEAALPDFRSDLADRLADVWRDDQNPGEGTARVDSAIEIYGAALANRRKLHGLLEEEAALYEIFAATGWTGELEYAFNRFYDRLEDVSVEGVTLANRLYTTIDPAAGEGAE
ncbi:MAG: hypothetical protein AAF415_02665 [Pseudomonadota bacterium]